MVEVLVNDLKIAFIELNFFKSLESLAGSFSITTRKRLEIGKTIRIVINDQVCLDGYVEVSTSKLSSTGTSYTASGRDKTGDLVDSCIETKEIKDKSLLEVLQSLTAKFGIESKTLEKLKISLKPNPGDSIFTALTKVLGPREIKMFTRSGELHAGKILIASKPEFVFEEAKNIMSIEYTEDHTGRYRQYIGKKSIHDADLINFINPGKAKPIKDILLEDDGIQRPRSLILVSEEPEFECKQQKDLRKAKSKFVTLTTKGFHNDNKLFEVGKIAKINSPSMGLKEENMIINSVSINVSRSEKKVTKIELVSSVPSKVKAEKKEKEQKEWIKT